MKKYAGMAIALIAAAACGCIKFDQTITLNKDGSGEAKVVYAMTQQTIDQFKAMEEAGKKMAEGGEGSVSSESPFEFDKAKLEEQFKKYQDLGVTLKSAETTDKDGWKYMTLVMEFKDVSKLKDTEIFKDSKISIVKDAAGNYVISAPMGSEKLGQGAENEEQMKAMLPMFKGMRIALTLNTPTDIIETTSKVKSARSASWVYDLDADPNALLTMNKDEVKVVFDGKGVTIPEVKPAVEVPASEPISSEANPAPAEPAPAGK